MDKKHVAAIIAIAKATKSISDEFKAML